MHVQYTAARLQLGQLGVQLCTLDAHHLCQLALQQRHLLRQAYHLGQGQGGREAVVTEGGRPGW